MIVRLWLVTATLVISVAWGLTVFLSPPDYQMSAGTAILDEYRAAKLLPAAGATRLSADVGHAVFEVPAADAEHLKMAMASGGMAGMAMDMPMKMDMAAKPGDDAAKPAMKMAMKMPMKMDMAAKPADDAAKPAMKMAMKMPMKMDMAAKPADHAAKPAMKMAMKMPMTMAMAAKPDEHAEEGEGGHSSAGSGLTILASGSARPHGMIGAMAYKGARRIMLTMKEWEYSAPRVNVKTGEVLRFVITNEGSIPHEFMLMTGPAMQAVNYRLGRADWNLMEHEATYERPIVMPGDTFELLVRADRPGMWMYMCMFPYHMKFGMMGMLMASADTGSGAMKGMKMDMPGMNMKRN